jgi:hypothetical protein
MSDLSSNVGCTTDKACIRARSALGACAGEPIECAACIARGKMNNLRENRKRDREMGIRTPYEPKQKVAKLKAPTKVRALVAKSKTKAKAEAETDAETETAVATSTAVIANTADVEKVNSTGGWADIALVAAVAADEVAADEVAADEVATDEVAADEVAADEVAADEVAAGEEEKEEKETEKDEKKDEEENEDEDEEEEEDGVESAISPVLVCV